MSKNSHSKSDNCKWHKFVILYVQNELVNQEQKQFIEHLDNCLECREQIIIHREIIKELKNTENKSCPDLSSKIIAQIPQQAWNRSPIMEKSMQIAKIAAIVLIAIGCFYLVLDNTKSQPKEFIELVDLTKKQRKTTPDNCLPQALTWLASVQDQDGSWQVEKWGGANNYKVALTALGLMSFLKENQHPFYSDYAKNIKKAANYLVKEQRNDGHFGPLRNSTMYNHGIATVALLEVYGNSRDENIKPAIAKAIDYICLAQSSDGGWGYVSGSEMANTSVTIWQLQALLMANAVGWSKTKRHIRRGFNWLNNMVNEKGHIGYRSHRDFPYAHQSLTAMGAFCLFASGYRQNQQKNMINTIENIMSKQEDINYYRWYFLTYAVSMMPKKQSHRWQKNMDKLLVEAQIKVGPYSGSWNPTDRWGAVGGRVYATSMAVLSLKAKQRVPKMKHLLAWDN